MLLILIVAFVTPTLAWVEWGQPLAGPGQPIELRMLLWSALLAASTLYLAARAIHALAYALGVTVIRSSAVYASWLATATIAAAALGLMLRQAADKQRNTSNMADVGFVGAACR